MKPFRLTKNHQNTGVFEHQIQQQQINLEGGNIQMQNDYNPNNIGQNHIRIDLMHANRINEDNDP